MEAVQYYRTFLPLREMNEQTDIEAQCVAKDELEGVTDDELGGRDIYTMCRMYGPGYQGFIEEIHSRGGVFVLDSDDDLTEDYRLVSGRGDLFKEILSAADYVTTSTPYLADRLGRFTEKPPVVLRNHVDVDWMQSVASKARRVAEGLTIGFSGSPTHWGDWYLSAVPFARIGRDYPGVTLVLHGEVPRYLKHAAEKMVEFGGVPFSIYPALLAQFDILLCAVDVRDEFSKCKSAIKALEAMAVGAVPICSRFKPYMDLAYMGAPVVIIEEESREGWFEAMRQLVTCWDLRDQLASQGPAWVRKHRDMANGGYQNWEKFYREITD